MLKKHLVRFSMLIVLSVMTGIVPAYADDCEDYCRGFASGWCAAQDPPQSAHYQGCVSNPEGEPDCYFGCEPPV